MKTPREIHITPVLNGFICRVGCQTVVFDSHSDMIAALESYLINPEQVERDYRHSAMHKFMLEGPLAPEPCPVQAYNQMIGQDCAGVQESLPDPGCDVPVKKPAEMPPLRAEEYQRARRP